MIDIEFLSQYLLLKNITSLKNSNFEIPLSVDFILLKLLDKHVDHFDLKKVNDYYKKFRILELKKSIYPENKLKQLENEAIIYEEKCTILYLTNIFPVNLYLSSIFIQFIWVL